MLKNKTKKLTNKTFRIVFKYSLDRNIACQLCHRKLHGLLTESAAPGSTAWADCTYLYQHGTRTAKHRYKTQIRHTNTFSTSLG